MNDGLTRDNHPWPSGPLHRQTSLPRKEAIAQVSAVADTAGGVLLGETHGVVENAAVLEWFVRRFGPAQLGLEWRPSAATALWEYAKGLDLDVSRLRPSADGRITAGHLHVARQLVKDGLVTSVVVFAPDDEFELAGDNRSRNVWKRALAERLLASRDDRTPIIVRVRLRRSDMRAAARRSAGATGAGPSGLPAPRRAHHGGGLVLRCRQRL